ncbi:MAG: serine hydrolase [Chitinophagaceae bacterium]|nr:serine hydrolase [Chitinophagaceae bacterium]
MKLRKITGILLRLLCTGAIIYIGWLAYLLAPVISAYGAKALASGIYLQQRTASEFEQHDLSDFPFYLGRYTVNENDSSVTGSVLGFAERKAIYRKNAGVTVINDYSENEVRQQQFYKPPVPAVDVDAAAWPAGNRLADTTVAGVDKNALLTTMQRAMQEKFNGQPSETRAIVIVHNGQLIAEQYAKGYDRNSRMPAWSMTKSITASLIGILVKQNKLDINSPAPVAGWQSNNKKAITIRQLLQQCSGLDYEENYKGPGEAVNMLFKKGDMASYIAGLPLLHPPGTVFNYSSGNSNILSRIIRNTVGEEGYQAFPYEELLYKINMYSAQLEPDASGTYVGSSYCYATARDFARFGLFCCNNGKWNGEQVLPETWMKESTQPYDADPQQQYGYHFWLNGFADATKTTRIFPSAPADMYYASGYGGQYIYIIPSKKLVIVRLGLRKMDDDRFLKEVTDAF